MLTLNMIEFKDYSVTALNEYLEIQNETDYKIIYKKEYTFPEDMAVCIADEYQLVAYSFAQMAEISTVFSHYIPSPYLNTSFYCIISTTQMGLLAEKLFRSLKILYTDDPSYFENFKDDLKSYFDDQRENGQIYKVSGLLEIANAFHALTESDEANPESSD